MLCNLCPRQCNIDRTVTRGYCGERDSIRVARIAPHFFEEPPISGARGSGTVFFSGCSLGCVFCQNRDISRRGGAGHEISDSELYRKILELQEMGVHNLNLVTPTHFVHRLAPLIERLKASGDLKIPVVYNSSGYESLQTLKRLDGLIDIYMPDFKYFSDELAKKYSSAPDYMSVASNAIKEMLSQRGRYRYSKEEPDILESGVIVRHLVLPSHRADSIALLKILAELVDPNDILLSLMSQYTPDFATDTPYKNLHRRVTSFEYSSVCEIADGLGFEGFMQSKSSAVSDYTPDFK
jgi:putative pyruvate formate lyase activating enzyme